jgi:hypothetical protein
MTDTYDTTIRVAGLAGDDEPVETLRWAANDRVLGHLGSEELPVAAAEALARAVDSAALRELAGLARDDPREAADLLAQAATELGYPLRSPRAVRWDHARRAGAQLLAGHQPPPTRQSSALESG